MAVRAQRHNRKDLGSDETQPRDASKSKDPALLKEGEQDQVEREEEGNSVVDDPARSPGCARPEA